MLIDDLLWPLNQKALPDLNDNIVRSSQNTSVPDTPTKHTTKHVGIDCPVHTHVVHKCTVNSAIHIIYITENL